MIDDYMSSELCLLKKSARSHHDFIACVSYPDIYEYAILNLGFQQVIKEIWGLEGWLPCRSFLLNDTTFSVLKDEPLLMWETKTELSKSNICFFSIASEDNCLNVLKMLKQAQIPLKSKERDEHFPLIIAGGPFVNYNPYPLADFIDIFVIGECEGTISEILQMYEANYKNRTLLLKRLNTLPYLYIPSLQKLNGLVNEETEYIKTIIVKNKLHDYSCAETHAIYISTKNYKGIRLLPIEVVRGCGFKCRFCHLGSTLRLERRKPLEYIKSVIATYADYVDEFKLVYPSDIDLEILDTLSHEYFRKNKFRVNVGSLRASSISSQALSCLYKLGKSEISLAPETSERLRLSINKDITDDKFREVIFDAINIGFSEVCLFYVIGFPGESNKDIFSIFNFIDSVLDECYGGKAFKLILSINPFFPKPKTAMQWSASPDWAYTLKIIEMFRDRYEQHPKVIIETIIGTLAHYRQNILCRASRHIAPILIDMCNKVFDGAEETIELWESTLLEHKNYNANEATQAFNFQDPLPWDVFDHGVSIAHLADEYNKSKNFELTPHCSATCSNPCGVCTHHIVH